MVGHSLIKSLISRGCREKTCHECLTLGLYTIFTAYLHCLTSLCWPMAWGHYFSLYVGWGHSPNPTSTCNVYFYNARIFHLLPCVCPVFNSTIKHGDWSSEYGQIIEIMLDDWGVGLHRFHCRLLLRIAYLTCVPILNSRHLDLQWLTAAAHTPADAYFCLAKWTYLKVRLYSFVSEFARISYILRPCKIDVVFQFLHDKSIGWGREEKFSVWNITMQYYCILLSSIGCMMILYTCIHRSMACAITLFFWDHALTVSALHSESPNTYICVHWSLTQLWLQKFNLYLFPCLLALLALFQLTVCYLFTIGENACLHVFD